MFFGILKKCFSKIDLFLVFLKNRLSSQNLLKQDLKTVNQTRFCVLCKMKTGKQKKKKIKPNRANKEAYPTAKGQE